MMTIWSWDHVFSLLKILRGLLIFLRKKCYSNSLNMAKNSTFPATVFHQPPLFLHVLFEPMVFPLHQGPGMWEYFSPPLSLPNSYMLQVGLVLNITSSRRSLLPGIPYHYHQSPQPSPPHTSAHQDNFPPLCAFEIFYLLYWIMWVLGQFIWN